jgi:hypothetical protein
MRLLFTFMRYTYDTRYSYNWYNIPVAQIEGRLHRHFIRISITTHIASAWKNYYIWSCLEVPVDF